MNKSPLPSKEANDTMTFPEAMKQIIQGEKVTKLEWNDPETYLILTTHLYLHKSAGTEHPLIVSDGDMLGEDWIVV